MKNGTRLCFQNIFRLSFRWGKHANYLISLCSHFARKSLGVKVKRPKDSWFPWKMGQDCAFRLFSVFHLGGQTCDYCFYGHRAKRTSSHMWDVSFKTLKCLMKSSFFTRKYCVCRKRQFCSASRRAALFWNDTNDCEHTRKCTWKLMIAFVGVVSNK